MVRDSRCHAWSYKAQKATIALSIAAATALGTSGAVLAQSPSDVTCLVASNVFAKGSKDEKQRAAAMALRMFYFGRVDAQFSGSRLKNALQAAARNLTDANAAAVMNSCNQAAAARLRAYEALAAQVPKPKR